MVAVINLFYCVLYDNDNSISTQNSVQNVSWIMMRKVAFYIMYKIYFFTNNNNRAVGSASTSTNESRSIIGSNCNTNGIYNIFICYVCAKACVYLDLCLYAFLVRVKLHTIFEIVNDVDEAVFCTSTALNFIFDRK